MDAGLVALDVRGQEVRIHPVEVPDEVHEVEAGPHAQEGGDLSELEVEVDEERLAARQAVQLDTEVGHDRGRPRPTLGGEERQEASVAVALRRVPPSPLAHDAAQGVPQDRRFERARHVFHEPGAHRLEEVRGVEIRTDAHDGGARVGRGDRAGHADGALGIVGHVEDHDVGLARPKPLEVLGVQLR